MGNGWVRVLGDHDGGSDRFLASRMISDMSGGVSPSQNCFAIHKPRWRSVERRVGAEIFPIADRGIVSAMRCASDDAAGCRPSSSDGCSTLANDNISEFFVPFSCHSTEKHTKRDIQNQKCRSLKNATRCM